jgi:hypothetical protein
VRIAKTTVCITMPPSYLLQPVPWLKLLVQAILTHSAMTSTLKRRSITDPSLSNRGIDYTIENAASCKKCGHLTIAVQRQFHFREASPKVRS